jgi:predicted HNH restriction endonuclease
MEVKTTMQPRTTLLLAAMATCKRQSEHLLDQETLALLKENKRIIHALANYIPKTEKELEMVNRELRKYRLIQKRLTQVWDKDLIQKFAENNSPVTCIKKSNKTSCEVKKLSKKQSTDLKRNDELIKELSRFNPYDDYEVDFARDLYKEYREIQVKLGGISGITRLSLNTKDESIRKMNRKRILALVSESCQICGFPVQRALDVHHIKPVSWHKKGDDPHVIENESVVCPNCHRFAHHCLCLEYIPDEIRDYLEPIDGAVENLERFVRMGLEA